MFTGIVEEVGVVHSLEPRGEGARLRIRCSTVLEDISRGASVAVNGACLTAAELVPGLFVADVTPETLRRTNLGQLRPGSLVNLERPLSPSGRLHGHLVQGHVDGTAILLSLRQVGSGDWWLEAKIPANLAVYVAPKGSIALDGISLTVASIQSDIVGVAIIPFTFQHTNLHSRRPGDLLNMECDILAKYVVRFLQAQQKPSALTLERLRELGF